jgi:glycosyltransferase involved in cell wall biosynthesis
MSSRAAARPRLLFTNNWTRFFLSHRLDLARAAREAGYDVHVAAPDEPEQATIRAEGFTFHTIPLSRQSVGPATELRTVRAIVRLYRSVNPDIVHHVAMKAVLYGGLAARVARVPAVVNAFTGLGWLFSDAPGPRVARAIAGAPFRFALSHPNSRTIFQNEDDAELFVRSRLLARERIVIIRGSGVDPRRFEPRPEPEGDERVVVLPARMLWSKGIREYAEAARTLRERGRRVRMVLVGPYDGGNPTAVPQDQLDLWNREGLLEWWGARTDMPEVLAASHVVCLPSHREGLPKSLLEAAACARAAVTTDTPGCRHAVVDGVTGIVVPLRDPVALAGAIDRVTSNDALRHGMAQRARERFLQEFTLAKVLDKTLAVYDDLLARAGRTRVSFAA